MRTVFGVIAAAFAACAASAAELDLSGIWTLAAAPLAHDVVRFGATDDLALAVPTADTAAVAFRLEAAGRFRFGEKRIWRPVNGVPGREGTNE